MALSTSKIYTVQHVNYTVFTRCLPGKEIMAQFTCKIYPVNAQSYPSSQHVNMSASTYSLESVTFFLFRLENKTWKPATPFDFVVTEDGLVCNHCVP